MGKSVYIFFLLKNKLFVINFYLIILEFFLFGKKGDFKLFFMEFGEGIWVLNMMIF